MRIVASPQNRIAIARLRTRIALAGRVGLWGGATLRSRYRPSSQEVKAAFGDLSKREIQKIRREVTSLEYRNQALGAMFHKVGLEPLLPLVLVDPGPLFRLLREKTPVVIVAWHMGPHRHLMATLRKLNVDALMAVGRPSAIRADSDRLKVIALQDKALAASFLRQAVDMLGSGGVVAMALDGTQGAGHPVTFLGQKIEVGRGAAALVRVAGAQLVPLTARWIGDSGTLSTRLHLPIPVPAVDRREAVRFDAELLAAATRWFEEDARRCPGNVRLRRLRKRGKSRSPECSASQPRD